MKQALIGTPLAGLALSVRAKWNLVRAALTKPEEISSIANDLIAHVILERFCKPGETFLDVGAHIGSVIDGVRRHSRAIRLIAVEPIPAKAAHLARKFSNIEVHRCAVGEAAGIATFYVHRLTSGYSSLAKPDGSGANVNEIVVPVRTIDDILDGQHVDLVKIDVEGFELAALRGARGTLMACRPVVLVESGPEVVSGYSKEALWSLLDDVGYELLIPNRLAHEGEALSKAAFLESHLYPRRTIDYFAVPKETRDDVRARARTIMRVSP